METKSPTVSVSGQSWIWRALSGLPAEYEPLHWHVVNHVKVFTNDTFESPLSDITSKFFGLAGIELDQAIEAAILSAASDERYWLEQKDLAFLKN